jgi:hypothetical protein
MTIFITKDLVGRALDIAVAMALMPGNTGGWVSHAKACQYSGNYEEGARLITNLRTLVNLDTHWQACGKTGACGEGPTFLIAVARCVAAEKFGLMVTIPDELLVE